MKNHLNLSLAIPALALLFSAGVLAEKKEKIVVALETDAFELAETDVSDLAVGEAETIVTESGKTIDLLRTEDGIEIYVDGELLDIGNLSGPHHDAGALHGEDIHIVRKHHVVKCVVADEGDGETACDDETILMDGENLDVEALHADGDAHGLIVRHLEVECVGEDETECASHKVWVSDGESVDPESPHAGAHKIIKIRKSSDRE